VKLNVFLAYTSNGPIALRLLDKRLRMDKRGRIRLRVRCVSESKTCVARLIAYHGRPIAFGKATLPSGEVRRMRLRLPKGIRRSVRRHRKGVVVRVDATDQRRRGRHRRGEPAPARAPLARPPGEAGAGGAWRAVGGPTASARR